MHADLRISHMQLENQTISWDAWDAEVVLGASLVVECWIVGHDIKDM
jgi:hypothetical protein